MNFLAVVDILTMGKINGLVFLLNKKLSSYW